MKYFIHKKFGQPMAQLFKWLIVVLLCTGGYATSAQVPVLLSGTTFDPVDPTDTSRAFWGENDILYYGIQGGRLTIVPPLATNVNADIFDATFQSAITNNPWKLDKTRYNRTVGAASDNQLVISPYRGAGQTHFVTYKLSGLKPAANVEVRISYCNVVSTGYTTCGSGEVSSFRGIVNPIDASNSLNGGDESPQIKASICSTKVITQSSGQSKPIGADGELNFFMSNMQTGNCKAISIKSIEVWGVPKPKIMASTGTEVCTGEQITLTATQGYNATHQWQYKLDAGVWTDVPNGTQSTALFEATSSGTYQFQLVITASGTSYPSDAITVVSKVCCEVGNPAVPASRQTIFYDNFGRLDPSDVTGHKYFVWDYSDVNDIKEVPKTTVGTEAFRWRSDSPPVGFTYKATGSISDGEYAVASYLTYDQPVNGYNGAMLDWASRIKGPITDPSPKLFYDHTGEATNNPFGGVLLINCTPSTYNKVLYSKKIENLCNQKKLFFECWIAVFTNSSLEDNKYKGVNVRVKLTEVGNPSNFFETPVEGIKAEREKDGGGVWVPVRGELTLSGAGNAFTLEVINNQDVGIQGNDLAIDDIKVMACSPPSIEAFFNANLDQTISVCPTNSPPDALNLLTKPSAMLTAYYLSNPYFLFQWTRTPNVLSSWQNLDVPSTALTNGTITNTATHPSFAGILATGKVYFRVIAASGGAGGTFEQKNNFQGINAVTGKPNYANINEPCKNYSVSEPIEAGIGCTLPVHLLSFTATKQSSTNLIQWATVSESNNERFVIERSADAVHFVEIGTVKGKGNSNILRNYEFVDGLPSEGINYYRLKQIDASGAVEYSKTIALQNETAAGNFSLYPNPNKGSFTIKVAEVEVGAKVEIVDINGRSIYQAGAFSESNVINVEGLREGIYFVKLIQEQQIATQKVVVY